MTDQQMSATIYKGLFTDAEWQIIDYALSEYQDHLDEDDNEIEILQFNSSKTQRNLYSHKMTQTDDKSLRRKSH